MGALVAIQDVKDTLMKLPHVQKVTVERVEGYKVVVEIDSEPWVDIPRYEVYKVEEELLREYPGLGLDFRLVNNRETGANHPVHGVTDRGRRAEDA